MTPKGKAIELRDKMKSCLFSDGFYDSKKCALICVDEILNFMVLQLKWSEDYNGNVEYWSGVKSELENL